MAFQTKGRDPLFDSSVQAAIEKRGLELVGLGLIALGLLTALIVWTYSPEDPSWMSATTEPAQNFLGRFGATLAAPLVMIAGLGAWAISVVLVVWGARLTLHRGTERAVRRIIFAPIAVAAVSIYAATLSVGPDWGNSFGYGGLFGDTALAMLMTFLPLGTGFAVKLLSLVAALAIVGFGAFVLGFDRAELNAAWRFFVLGLIVLYVGVLRALGYTLKGTVWGANAAYAGVQNRRAVRAERAELRAAEPPMDTSDRVAAVVRARTGEVEVAVEEPEQSEQSGFLARMPSLFRRTPAEPQPEAIEVAPFDEDDPQDDRIKARITDAIRHRVRPPMTASTVQKATAGRRGPEPLIAQTTPTGVMPAEPPLTAAQTSVQPEISPVVQQAVARAAQSHQAMPEAELPEMDEVLFEAPMAPVVEEAAPLVQPAARRSILPSRKAKAEAQPSLPLEAKPEVAYEHPPLGLLASPETIARHHLSDEALEQNARMLENVLDDYGVKGDIVSVRPGPVVTMYELEPAPGLKASRVIGLADDIARSMSALSARVSTVPGRSVIGIELPNEDREMVVLREILAARDFGDSTMRLPLALGKDIGGDAIVANLAKMPHLLIAGTTGSGKSVAINTMILSLLYKLTPEECRLIMIDPKMLELSVYDGIPHLLSPVVTDPKKAVVALKWVVGEMEERYRKMSKMGVRNIEGYNGRVRETLAKGEMFSRTVQTGFDENTGEPIFETEEITPEVLPYIVVIVDEMADLMMVAGKEIEACIQRLAQMARASGIHLIMATQRPSVDVITGTIKANFPTRISFQVTGKIDSRTILGEQGAEQLLGQGDMLYMAGGAKITRVHGPFCSDEEVEEIVTYLKQFGPPDYMSGVVDGPEEGKESDIDLVLGLGGNTDGEDALYDTAVAIVVKDRKCSTSYIQRKLAIGYNKAARLVEQMEDEGVVSSANHVGKREILVPEQG